MAKAKQVIIKIIRWIEAFNAEGRAIEDRLRYYKDQDSILYLSMFKE